jgi:hypothetical protein
MAETATDKLAKTYEGLTEREQMLVKVAGVVLPVIALTFVGLFFNNSLSTVRQQIDDHEQMLKLVGDVAPKYQKSQKKGADKQAGKFSNEALEKNDVKLTSFVATHATAVGVQVDSYDENERPLGSENDEESSSLTKLRVTVKIREADHEKLMKLLERIETANEPVVIERITMTQKRRDPGKVRATLIVTTYKRKAKG